MLKIKSESELIWSIDADNVLHLFQASKIYSAAELEKRCLQFTAKQIIGVTTTSPFMESLFPILNRKDESVMSQFMPEESFSHYRKMRSIYEANKK